MLTRACLAVSIVVCGIADPAGAAISVGQLDPGTPSTTCAGNSTWTQAAESGTPSYVAPSGRWVLVSWSHRANSTSGRQLGVRVLRPTATAGTYTIAGAGALQILTPGGINTFYDRITVMGSDVLGLRVGNPPSGLDIIGGGAACVFSAAVANSVRYSVLVDEQPQGGDATLAGLLSSYRLNLIARLEPDADADGYGDESQDHCPTVAAPAGCPAATPAPAPDTEPPSAKVTSRRDSIRDGRIAVWVTANEAATATARGSLRIGAQAAGRRLRTAVARLAANHRQRMLLRLSKRTRRAARRALRRKQRLRVEVTVTLRDSAGNTGSAKQSVSLKR